MTGMLVEKIVKREGNLEASGVRGGTCLLSLSKKVKGRKAKNKGSYA